MKTRLNNMPYAQAHTVHYDDGLKVLVSYTTPVAELTKDGWLEILGLYSATTRRHIGAFMKEYTPFNYQLAKQLFEDGMKLNIYTGEVIKL